jgi:antitoxin (DNA-binding transcriptional repressor) of toxin-antitoxin stability system
MAISPSALRADIYNLIDRVIETGEPLEIERRGVIVRLVPPSPSRSWIEELPRRDGVITGDPDDLPDVDLSGHWSAGDDL